MDCPKCGGDMWDNRQSKKNPKQPDFKCKDKENCDGVIWPPRGKASGQAPAPRQRAASGNGNDDRSNRIERQHSQEMAVRWITLLTTLGVMPPEDVKTPKKLRETIDFFQRDVGRTASATTTTPREPEGDHNTGDEEDVF